MGGIEDFSRFNEQLVTGRGQHDIAAVSLDQFDPKLLFKLDNLSAQRWLTDMTGLGCFTEVLVTLYGIEVFQFSKLYHMQNLLNKRILCILPI